MEDGDEVHLDMENGEAQKSKPKNKRNVMLKDGEGDNVMSSKRGISIRHRRLWKERDHAFRFHGLPSAGRCNSEENQQVATLDLRISRAQISHVKEFPGHTLNLS